MRHERVRAGDRQTADVALAGRDVPRLVVAGAERPALRPLTRAKLLEEYRAWASAAPSSRASRASGGESRVRDRRALRAGVPASCSTAPRRRSSSSCHSLPVAYALAARDGDAPGARVPLAENATPYPFTRGRARARPSTCSSAWLAAPTLVDADFGRGRARADRGAHPRARADRARRRGALPRLGRRRLDLPPARAARARLPGGGAPRRPRPARRGVRRRTRASAPRCSAPRSCAPPGAASARPSCATSATRRRPERLRATGHTASDQVETILYRLVTSGNAKGIKARREDGVVRPLLPLWREETRGVLPRARASSSASTPRTPARRAG